MRQPSRPFVPNARGVHLVNGEYESNSRLCDKCGGKEMCKAHFQSYKDNFEIKKCRFFVPILPFKPPHKNIESGLMFNTIRLGTAWTKRLDIKGLNDSVAFFDVKEKNVFGYGRVVKVYSGDKEEIIREHAARNHLFIREQMSKDEAGDLMMKRLNGIFGTIINLNSHMATALYIDKVVRLDL